MNLIGKQKQNLSQITKAVLVRLSWGYTGLHFYRKSLTIQDKRAKGSFSDLLRAFFREKPQLMFVKET